MPWFITEEIHVQWQSWETMAHFMGITPHQATSRRIAQRRNIRRATLVRRGIMMEFEHDFVKTALGQMSFVKGLGQIARSIQETANVEVIRALVNAHRFQQKYIQDHFILQKGDLKAAMERDRDRFGLVQKDQFGLETWDATVNKEQYIWQGMSNAIIMTEEIAIYTTFVGPNRTLYKNAGEIGPARINNTGPKVKAAGETQGKLDRLEPLHMVRDVPVYIARSFHVDTVGKEELLSRVRAIGEYNLMIDECPSEVAYQSSSRDISIFDEDHDDFDCITLDMAIDNCGIFDKNSSNVSGHLLRPANIYGVARDDATETMRRDLSGNFLAMPSIDGKEFMPIQFIGDIAKEFLSDESLERCAESVAAAIYRGDTQKMMDDARVIAKGARKAAENKANKGKYGSVSGKLDTALTFVGSRLAQLMGSGALFTDKTEDEAARDIRNNFLTDGEVRIVGGVDKFDLARTEDRAQAYEVLIERAKRAGNTAEVERLEEAQKAIPREDPTDAQGDEFYLRSSIEKADGALFKALMAPVETLGEQYAAPAREIAADESRNAEERAFAIRDHLHNLVEQKVPGLIFQNRAAATQFFNTRIDGYRKHIGKLQATKATEKVAPVEGEEQVSWHAPGQKLPEGWRYMHSYSERNGPVSKSRGFIPDNILGVSSFLDKHHERMSQTNQRQQQTGGRYAPGADRMGAFASLGAMNFGEQGSADTDVLQRIKDRHLQDPEGRPWEAPGRVDEVTRRFHNLSSRMKAMSESSASALVQMCAMAFLGARFNKETLKMFRRNHIRIPCGFILARPQITYRTRTIIKVQADGGCGNMFFGHSDMQIGHDTARKIGIAHYTAYMAAVIHSPKNVYVQHDAMVANYLGGHGTQFFSPESYKAFTRSNQTSPDASICCFMIPYEERDIPLFFDISGRFYTQMRSGLADQRQGSMLAFSTAPIYNDLYGFYDPIARTRAMDEPDRRQGRKHVNRIVWRGCQYNKNIVSGRFDKYRANQGHLGPAIYPGCGQVFNGKIAYLDPKCVLASTGN